MHTGASARRLRRRCWGAARWGTGAVGAPPPLRRCRWGAAIEVGSATAAAFGHSFPTLPPCRSGHAVAGLIAADGAKDDNFKVRSEWAEAREATGPTIVQDPNGLFGAARLAQHLYASLLMCTEAGTEAHSILDNTPGKNGLEAWRRHVPRFDPTSTRTNRDLTGKILKPPMGRVENLSCLIEQWEEIVRRQDKRTGRQAVTDDTKRAINHDGRATSGRPAIVAASRPMQVLFAPRFCLPGGGIGPKRAIGARVLELPSAPMSAGMPTAGASHHTAHVEYCLPRARPLADE